jgi:hypothetical protein
MESRLPKQILKRAAKRLHLLVSRHSGWPKRLARLKSMRVGREKAVTVLADAGRTAEVMRTELDSLDEAISAHIQISCARYIRWLVAEVILADHAISIKGWALPFFSRAERYRFLINGVPFSNTRWPIPSSDLVEFFPIIGSAKQARFECVHCFEVFR